MGGLRRHLHISNYKNERKAAEILYAIHGSQLNGSSVLYVGSAIRSDLKHAQLVGIKDHNATSNSNGGRLLHNLLYLGGGTSY